MTPQERAAAVVKTWRMPQGDIPIGWADDCESAIAVAIEAAVVEEREACAKRILLMRFAGGRAIALRAAIEAMTKYEREELGFTGDSSLVAGWKEVLSDLESKTHGLTCPSM